jgi:hypothetical protein
MSTVVITSTVTHHTGHPRETIREALEDDPNAKVIWDGKEVIGVCPVCSGVLIEGDDLANCTYCN